LRRNLRTAEECEQHEDQRSQSWPRNIAMQSDASAWGCSKPPRCCRDGWRAAYRCGAHGTPL
jgi:hypothetical protein